MLIKRLCQNYNSVDLYEENGERIVRKSFKEKFCWENETKTLEILKNHGFPIPKILKIDYLENTYEFIDEPSFNKTLDLHPEKVNILIGLLNSFSNIYSEELYRFSNRNERLIKESEKLFDKRKIDILLINKLTRLSNTYKPEILRFVHGDFRPINIFGKDDVRAIIDTEFCGIDDPNKDLAYLWVGAVSINKYFNHYLKEKFRNLNYFNDGLFTFWQAYFHIMVMNNPKTKNPEMWKKNLEQILG